jgi:acetyl esterase/lipase
MLLSFLMAMGASARATVRRDVVYGPGATGKLDVYAPVGADGEAPVVVFAHSGWPKLADKKHFAMVGAMLASRGFVTLIPDFHVFPNCRYPDFVQDIARAAAWARGHCADYGGDPQRLFLVGHSGGAYVGAMLALDPQWLEGAGMTTGDIRGVVGICGPYDFLPLPQAAMNDVFGGEQNWAAALPVNHACASAPPMLLVAGGKDHLDPDRNTGALARALRTVGGQVAEIRYPTLGDSLGLHSLMGSLHFRATALVEVERFIRLHSLDLA